MVQKIDVVMGVPKEGKEVIDFICALIKDIKEKKSLTELMAELPKLVLAVEGLGNLGEELKSDGKDELAAYVVKEVIAALS